MREVYQSKPLPELDRFSIDRVQEFLITKFPDVKRPPELTAALLTLLVELHKLNEPYPERAVVAEFLNGSKFGLDAAINRSLERELITIETRTRAGDNSNRSNVVLVKYYKPSQELIDVVCGPKPGRRRA